ncbi:MAG: [FeFe] hydrogenase H-cluster maturation GTPase HydF [Bacteroidales bacterium]|jgi:[FeFe] hydrogenase H-cluster maturation GTPase HydF|nr:[FeFe] hydrogenase H-cluster maturation GTPase HydF [Bacteroidales bacterium]
MTKGRDLKPHIGIFGRRNHGKSSFINVLVGQDVSIVSDIPGTTTDPVKKSIEIFGIGPSIVIDTAGIDDHGDLGEKRIQKTTEVLELIDCAVLLIAGNLWGDKEREIIQQFKALDIPFIIVHNKKDQVPLREDTREAIFQETGANIVDFSTREPENLEEIVELLKKNIPENAYQEITLFGDLLQPDDMVVMVMPIDNEAPDGRLILPQVMALRDALDHHCISVVLQESELPAFFKNYNLHPKLVITDSQAFEKVNAVTPDGVALTSFSILFARLKGDFERFLQGTPKISHLNDGDKILIMESCSHHVHCDDIGRFKIPNWLTRFTGKQLSFEIVSSFQAPTLPIQEYALLIQCGGCMITRKQLLSRLKPAITHGVSISNYGMAIAYMHGIFDKATRIFRS